MGGRGPAMAVRLALLAGLVCCGLLGCADRGPVEVVSADPELTSSPQVSHTPRQVVLPTPVETPTVLSNLWPDADADDYRDVLTDGLGYTCPEVEAEDDLLWTCTYRDEVAISFFGADPPKVTAMRIRTPVGDPGDWMRGMASLVGVDVHGWVADRVRGGSFSDETVEVTDGVWVRTTRDADSDELVISVVPLEP